MTDVGDAIVTGMQRPFDRAAAERAKVPVPQRAGAFDASGPRLSRRGRTGAAS